MECNTHHFDPSHCWGKELVEKNEYELKAQCLRCGKVFTFTEPLNKVSEFCYNRAIMREQMKKFGHFEVRFGGM